MKKSLVLLLLLATSLLAGTQIFPINPANMTVEHFLTVGTDPNWKFECAILNHPTHDKAFWGISRRNDSADVKIYDTTGTLRQDVNHTCLNKVKDIKIFKTNNFINYITVITTDDTLFVLTNIGSGTNGGFTTTYILYFPHTNIYNNIQAYEDSLYITKQDSLFSMDNNFKTLKDTDVDAFFINEKGTWTTKSTTLYLNGNSIKTIQSSTNLFVTNDSTSYTTGTDGKLNRNADDLYVQIPGGSTPQIEIIQLAGFKNSNPFITIKYEPEFVSVFDTIISKIDIHSKDTITLYNYPTITNYGLNTDLYNDSILIGKNDSIKLIALNSMPIATNSHQDSIQHLNISTKRIRYAYSINIEDDNHSSFTFSKLEGPSWFSIPSSGNSIIDTIDETNANAGNYDISIEISDGISKDTTNFSFTIYYDTIAITETPSNNGTNNILYKDTLKTNKNAFVNSHNLPNFLSISKISNTEFEISGTPTKSDTGTHDITITMTDSIEYTNCNTTRKYTFDSTTFSITINYSNSIPQIDSLNGISNYSKIRAILSLTTTDTAIFSFSDADNDIITILTAQADSMITSISGDTIFSTPNPSKISDTITNTKLYFTYTDGDTTLTDSLVPTIALFGADTTILTEIDSILSSDTTQNETQTIITDSVKIITTSITTLSHESNIISTDTTTDTTKLADITSNNFPQISNSNSTIELLTEDSTTFILSTNDTDPLTFEFSADTNYISISNTDSIYTIKAKQTGSTTCTLKVTDGLKTISFTLTIEITEPSAIIPTITNTIKPYINLYNGILSYGLSHGNVNIKIYNIQGRLIKNITGEKSGHYKVNLNLASGFYAYKAHIANYKTTKKAIIAR